MLKRGTYELTDSGIDYSSNENDEKIDKLC